MKKSLIVSISAVLLSVLTLGACGPTDSSTSENISSQDTSVPGPSEGTEIFTIDQLLNGEISDDTGYWEPTYNGRHVRIEKAGVVLAYEHEMYIQQTTGETVGDLHSIQIVNNETDFTEYFYNNLVNVEGDVALLEDRIVLENATVELVDDGKDKEDNFVYFWPNMDRTALDNGTKFYAGTMVSSILQVASKPTTVVEGQEMTFQVTFPGEDLDTTNEENIFLMDFTVPSCLKAEEIEEVNALFSGLEVGDGLYVLATLHFIEGYFSYLYMPGVGTNEIYNYPTTLDNIFKTAEEVKNGFLKFHTTSFEEFPVLEAIDSKTNKNLIYSYVGDDSRYTSATNNLYMINAYTYNTEEVYEILRQAFLDANWTIRVEDASVPVVEFESPVQEGAGKPHNTVDLIVNEGSVSIGCITNTPFVYPHEANYDTFEELAAGLKLNVERYAKAKDFLLANGARNYKTGLVDVKSILGEGELVTTYHLSKKKESINVVNNIEAAHELVRFELNVADETRLNALKEAYIEALKANGFVAISVPKSTKKVPTGDGLYNHATGEWIALKDITATLVPATTGEEAHDAYGTISLYVDAVSIEVSRTLKGFLPEAEA